MTPPPVLDRRHAIAGTALGLMSISACGDGGGEVSTGYGPPSPTGVETPSREPAPTPSTPTAPDEPEEPQEPRPGLVGAADVPVGGGVILADAGIVVTQPERGTFRGFSSTCTHLGCTVGTVEGGTITCPCHGSQYSAANGSVTRGPATQGLARRELSVTDGQIHLD